MGTFDSFRKAYGALKDTTKVQLVKINGEFKDLDIAIVKATNHVECPPRDRHIRRIFWATSMVRPRADVAYCIHALSRRFSKSRNWIVAIKTLIVIHRTLREGDPTFREELLNYARRGQVLHISNFKDDSSPLAWDCSAWVRTYASFLEEWLECFRTLKYDIEAERLTKSIPGTSKAHSRTRLLSGEELLEQLPALQQLLYRLIACHIRISNMLQTLQPEGAAYHNYLVQYALSLSDNNVGAEGEFENNCAINDGTINLVDMFFDMCKHDAVKALNIYKRAGQQAENLAEFYDFCKGLHLARNFQFPTLRQPPPSFLATMEEYIKEASQMGSTSDRRMEYQDTVQEPQKPKEPDPEESEKQVEEVDDEQELVETEEEPEPKKEDEVPPLIAAEETGDLLGLNEVNPRAAELDESNALALAIFQPGNDPQSMSNGLSEIGKTSGWELALVMTPSNSISNAPQNTNMAGGFDKLLLDSLYEDDASRRQIQLHHAGYNTYGYGMPQQNPFEQVDPFAMSKSIAPPTNVQMAMIQQQQMLLLQQQQQQNMMMMVPHQNPHQYPPQQQMPYMGSSKPFGDPFSYPPQSPLPSQGNHTLL